LALMPWVSAMPATDAPGCRAAATSWDLNSGLFSRISGCHLAALCR
jgi:hypothetical protein